MQRTRGLRGRECIFIHALSIGHVDRSIGTGTGTGTKLLVIGPLDASNTTTTRTST